MSLFADAVGFDFDHTLGIDHHLERTVALELMQPKDESAADRALVAYRTGARRLDDTLVEIGVDPVRFRALVMERASHFVEPLAGALTLLEELRRRSLPVAILSNGWSPLQELKAKLIGFAGPVLVSDTIGVRKPALGAFLCLERALGTSAGRIAYVGDDPLPDVGGALNAGMQAIWFDWEGHTYPQELAQPTVRVTALTDILHIVQGPLDQTAKPPA